MSSCVQMEQALLDEGLPRPEGLEAHLAGCVDCRALRASHREALRLRGLALVRTRGRPLGEVQRRAGIVVGLVLALGGGVGWYQVQYGALAPVKSAPAARLSAPEDVELAKTTFVEAPEGELLALAELQATVSAQLNRDPRQDEAAVHAFGSLPRWTAPEKTRPMRSLGRAASPVVFTSEDAP
jgi:hypothetical protein